MHWNTEFPVELGKLNRQKIKKKHPSHNHFCETNRNRTEHIVLTNPSLLWTPLQLMCHFYSKTPA